MIISKAVNKLVNCHDLFSNEILSDMFVYTNCINDITGDVKEGFKLKVEVEESNE